jgi:hypothetical protein
VNGYEFHELLLPDGRRVASGSLSHCWNERERWEDALDVRVKSKCKQCKRWIFSTTIGSPDTPEWHCRHGFTPSDDCQKMADYNDDCQRQYYRKHPEELQLELDFQ